jgi:hypothetical protein
MADRDGERIFVDLLDAPGRWIDHAHGSLEPGGTLGWDWSDDNDPTVRSCAEGGSSAICRGPDGGDGYYSGSIICD